MSLVRLCVFENSLHPSPQVVAKRHSKCFGILLLLHLSYHWSNRRVHISEATRAALGDAFEVEDGRGCERDEYLRGTNTYLIVEKVGHTCRQGTWAEPGIMCDFGGHVGGWVLVGFFLGGACGRGMWEGFLWEGHLGGVLLGGACGRGSYGRCMLKVDFIIRCIVSLCRGQCCELTLSSLVPIQTTPTSSLVPL